MAIGKNYLVKDKVSQDTLSTGTKVKIKSPVPFIFKGLLTSGKNHFKICPSIIPQGSSNQSRRKRKVITSPCLIAK